MNLTVQAPIVIQSTNHLPLLIRSLRERKGWTQTELARKLNTSQQAISRMEKSTDNLSVSRAIQVLATLDARFMVTTTEALKASTPKTDW